MSGSRAEFIEAVARKQRQPAFDPNRQGYVAPQPELSPLEKAFSDYQRMEHELGSVKAKNEDLLVTNMNLLSEVQMLREAFGQADADRMRLQAVSSTLSGQLLAINAVIADAMRLAIKHGVEATQPDPGLERAAGEAAEIIQRLEPVAAPAVAHATRPASAASALAPVEFRR